MANAARFAEQARTEEMTRTAELRTSQVSADNVSEDAQEKILEPRKRQCCAKTALRMLRIRTTKEVAAEELSRTRRIRKYEIGYQMSTDVSKAIAQVVRCGPAGQTWLKQQDIINEIKDNFKLKEVDEETLTDLRSKQGRQAHNKVVTPVAEHQTSGITCKSPVFQGPNKDKSEQG